MHEAKPLGAPNEAQGASATSSPFVMKTITLHREFHSQGFGFCLRGGVEHGVGHFVSSVDLGSIAENQGIKAGDQILSVEGLPLTTATHKEAVSFIASRNKLELEIKRVGAIPVKKSLGDSIQWIKCDAEAAKKLLMQSNLFAVERMLIDLGEDHAKGLGCSICKGPAERPGIYVQSIKANGAAHKSGLQLGDQILRCNDMSFEGPLNFNIAVAQMRGKRCLDLIVRRGAGLDLVLESEGDENNPTNLEVEQRKRLEDEKKLLQSQVQLERRKLEAEQERLRLEAMKLEAEKLQLQKEKQELILQQKSSSSNLVTSSSAASTASEATEASTENGGGLASAIQLELQRRKASSQQQNKPKPIIKPSSVAELQKRRQNLLNQNDTHDQLMAEFRKVHRKLFTSSNEETEEEEVEAAVVEAENVQEQEQQKLYCNRSYDETLVKPVKTLMTNPAPEPPERTTSISPTASPTSTASTFKSPSPNNNSLASTSPGIPTPDYSGSSPEPTPENNHLVRKSELKTFSKRHPSLENPEFSFGPSPIKDSSMHLNNNKNVRFDVRAEAALAAHDYRVAHATRKAIRYTTELHKTFAVRSGIKTTSVTSSGVSSSTSTNSASSPRNLSSEEDEEEHMRMRQVRGRSPKKHPAPPPPPPPPSNIEPKNVTKGIN